MTYINLDIRILHTLMYQVDLCYTDNNQRKKHPQRIFTEFLFFSSLSYWFTANSFAHELEGSHESYQRIKLPLYTPRPHNWQKEGLPCDLTLR